MPCPVPQRGRCTRRRLGFLLHATRLAQHCQADSHILLGSRCQAVVRCQTFDALFDINVKGNFFTPQKALPLLDEGASVVFTVGAAEVVGAAMTAAKGALLPLMRSLALELAPRRIRVNAVSPGMIDTPVYGKMGVSQEMIDSWARDVPLGRVGAPADIAEAVTFLASDAAAYITGDNLTVSGGIGVHSNA
ncbi:SDR family oxidoreductase [Streptomyces sp. NPDC007264]|uniref:SDR family oxidoreductase n=1 Tax=Streptomyces sp. NPDC007264 TaxID=3364777 RepID=UPI0036D8D90B